MSHHSDQLLDSMQLNSHNTHLHISLRTPACEALHMDGLCNQALVAVQERPHPLHLQLLHATEHRLELLPVLRGERVICEIGLSEAHGRPFIIGIAADSHPLPAVLCGLQRELTGQKRILPQCPLGRLQSGLHVEGGM